MIPRLGIDAGPADKEVLVLGETPEENLDHVAIHKAIDDCESGPSLPPAERPP